MGIKYFKGWKINHHLTLRCRNVAELSPWCTKEALCFAFDLFWQSPSSTFFTLPSSQKEVCVQKLHFLTFLTSLPGTAAGPCYSGCAESQNGAFREGNSIAALNPQHWLDYFPLQGKSVWCLISYRWEILFFPVPWFLSLTSSNPQEQVETVLGKG